MVSRICIVGLGYIGLPTAAMFADAGMCVCGVDLNSEIVKSVNAGELHIIEPGLGDVLARVVAVGKLRATTTPEPADAFIIAVPTPFKGNHEPDLSFIKTASKAIAPHLKSGDLVILESTSPVGATELMANWMATACPDLSFPTTLGEESDIRVAYCPERVMPGKILQELVENDRVVGGLTPRCAKAAADLYKIVVRGECLLTEARTAEMVKLTENAFRDVNIAFANELSLICDRLSIDVWELIQLANRHPRVNILQPGPGVGGHCIAVDPWFIVHAAPETAKLIHAARRVNDGKSDWVIQKVQAMVKDHDKRTIACFGLSFKPDVNDLRQSPALEITKRLAEEGIGEILVVEPHIDDLPPSLAERGVTLVDVDNALARSDVAILLVNHSAFKSIDPVRLHEKTVFDTCGVWR